MNRKKIIVVGIVILILVYAFYSVKKRLPVISAYAAKEVCSCIFIEGRDKDMVLNDDVNIPYISIATNTINFENKTVTSNVFGFAEYTAYYRQGAGCALKHNMDTDMFNKTSFELPEKPFFEPDTVKWPIGDLLKDTVFPEIQYDSLHKAMNSIFDTENELNFRTRAVICAYKNEIVFEKYAPGISKGERLLGWSMTKSVINALTGILVQQKKLSLQDSALFEQWENDSRKSITINNLLQMESGLDWDEDYYNLSTATQMLYLSDDMSTYAISRHARNRPQDEWYYSSGTSNILSRLIRETIGDDEKYYEFPYRSLFYQIGMHSAIIETDASGTFVGSSYARASARDWARLGLLYLNNGVWYGAHLLPENWVEYSTIPAKNSNGRFGAHIWLNKSKHLPDIPDDMFSFKGHNGQRVWIFPTQKLVVVRMGLKNLDKAVYNKFLKDVLHSIDNLNKNQSNLYPLKCINI